MKLIKSVVVRLLTLEARLILWRHAPRIIAITGSVGKTTTKDAIFAAIEGSVHARKSEKTLNSEFGVPLSIIGAQSGWNDPVRWIGVLVRGLYVALVPQRYPRWLVLEVGADRPGDIPAIARWLRPDIAVITGVPAIPSHVEFFDSPEHIVREKSALAEHLKPGGTLVVNGDDPNMRELRARMNVASAAYGYGGESEVSASNQAVLYEGDSPKGVTFRAVTPGGTFPVALYGGLGLPRVSAALAALAVARAVGVDEVTATKGLADWAPPPGRLRLLRGIKGSVIIDDTYNSSPAAALAALDTLASVRAKRRIAVLGDMLELGRYSTEAHRQVGERAARCADMLVTVGFRSRATAEAALDAGMPDGSIRQYEIGESSRAGKELERDLQEGDVMLIKGSQGVRMEKAVLEIMAEPERAEELLVRMDPDWRTR